MDIAASRVEVAPITPPESGVRKAETRKLMAKSRRFRAAGSAAEADSRAVGASFYEKR
jgi:hypothetical protein